MVMQSPLTFNFKKDLDPAIQFERMYRQLREDIQESYVNGTEMDHDSLLNYNTQEHINHNSVSIIAGTGLSGGGTIQESRTLTVVPGEIDHDALLNTHDLTTDIDHDSIANTHNLTTDVDHDAILNVHQDVNTDASPSFAGLTVTGERVTYGTSIKFNYTVGDYDTIIYGDVATPVVFVDAHEQRVGINTATPAKPLDVVGAVNTSEHYEVDGTQVVGNRGAAVADATGAGDVVAQLNALLARLRAHGLIET